MPRRTAGTGTPPLTPSRTPPLTPRPGGVPEGVPRDLPHDVPEDDFPDPRGPGSPRGRFAVLRSRTELRELLGEPYPIVIEKVHDRLTDDDTDIIARSPFCLLATSGAGGACDVSPRGDAPGFTRVVDPGTLALPERPGNRRGDSLRNILDNPHAGLLFLVPGSRDVLRVNGRVRILTDAPFFEALADNGRRPDLALLVEIEEIYRHCAQSLHRSGLWEPAAREHG